MIKMKQYMPVQIAVANCFRSVEADEIYSFIENNLEDVQTYSFDPDKVRDLRAKGHIIGAAIDYVVLLTNLAYITTIYKAAEILYAAYRKFIPKDGYAGLYIHLPDGTQIMLRQGDDNKDALLELIGNIEDTTGIGINLTRMTRSDFDYRTAKGDTLMRRIWSEKKLVVKGRH